MHRAARAATASLAVALTVALPQGGAARAATRSPDDVPPGVPAAALREEPRLQAPDGWPFAQRVSRTSGTGRLHGGASYWTDFVHDDHGAAVPGGMTLENTSRLAPEQGVYEYPAGPASGNGADVFVAATGVDAQASYWRVDWNTLVDPDVPLAVWTFDTDDDAGTGTAQWPADAGVTSPGLDEALVVSSRGAWLVDPATGERTDVTDAPGGRLTVDEDARSFVVRVPRSVLPVDGSWRVRLAAGLASEDGTTMAAPTTSGGFPTGGLPHVYNLAFRTAAQEPPVHTDGRTALLVASLQALAAGTPLAAELGLDGLARYVTGNFWMEDNQADTLATGDVSRFSRRIDWAALERRASTREPLVRGWSNRWYSSSLDLGEGVVTRQTEPTGDGRPNYLGRIQPYGVYVPTTYRPSAPAPLTWVLHSLDVNHNQYGGYDPRLLQQLCEQRGSICATTLGHGPDGWYFDEAEVDYWSAWRALAAAYSLDERRTVLTGYSMGGYAAYKLGLSHPDLYAEAMALAGPPACGVSLDGDRLTYPAFGGRCASDGVTAPLVGNARWLPYRIAHGTLDQLVPFTSVEAQVGRFDALGLRHLFLRYPGEDHLGFAVQDRFDTVVEGLGRPQVVRRPPVVDFTWRPHLTRPALGIGATTAYWLSRLGARDNGPGTLARVHARSFGIAGRGHTVVRTGPTPVAQPLPAVRTGLSWRPAAQLPTRKRLVLRLTNVRRVAVDLRRAGLRCGTVVVRTDGPAKVLLTRLPGGTRSLDVRDDRTVRLRCR